MPSSPSIPPLSHTPYVASDKKIQELSLQAVILGALFGCLFGAATVYLALKVGLTVSASIPIAVLAIALFKRFGHSTILENNIVQTVGSAGESIAAGVAFTLPALLFLSDGAKNFHYFQIFVLAACGGMLGVFFMIPLRQSLIVEEHATLPYPEGTACADVLIAGEQGGNLAKLVNRGIFVAVFYKILMSVIGLWKEVPEYLFKKDSPLPNASLSAEVTPELLGVGYIIGFRTSSIMVAGGILSQLILIPLISYFGASLNEAIAPATTLLKEMSPREIWSNYIRYIGAGAVTFGGVISMIRTIPMVVRTLSSTWKGLRGINEKKEEGVERLQRDIPIQYVIGASICIVAIMAILPNIPVTLFSSLLVVIASFFFVMVSSRITGIIGSSSCPTSGMTIAALMGTSLLFILYGLNGASYQAVALSVGAIVAISSATASAISQDLKTGFLVGATPIKQQIGMMCGVLASAIAVGFTIVLLQQALGFGEVTAEHPHPLPAPQAMLMATIIKGLFSQSLPWTLVLVGMGIAAVVELCGVSSLAFAVGAYLPLSTTSPIFIGGLLHAFLNRKQKDVEVNSEMEPGILFSSGLIAGGAIMGIVIAFLLGTPLSPAADGTPRSLMTLLNTGFSERFGVEGDVIAIGAFLLMISLLYKAARKKVV